MLDQPRSIPRHEIGIASLAPELIRDNYIFNLESSYEDYLTEFVNCSNLFLSLSNGEHGWLYLCGRTHRYQPATTGALVIIVIP